jgi:ABC-type protease/lipase transport system fused ATPase/permease subunit
MGLASLIFGGNTRTELKAPGTGKAVLTVDATIRAAHSAGATITKRELEKGAQVNDHMTTAPESVGIEGIISETPLDLLNSIGGAAVGAAASLASQAGLGAAAATGILGGSLLGAINGARTVNAFDLMVQLQKKRILFDLVTGLRNYQNMMLTAVTANRSAQIGKAIQFTATMEQITFVTSALISLGEGDMLGDIGASASGATNLGKQATSAAGADTSSNGSLLFQAFGGFFG